jgi:hypothetical protein
VTVGRGFDSSGGSDAAINEGEHDVDMWWRGSKKKRFQGKAPRLLVYAAANGQVRPGVSGFTVKGLCREGREGEGGRGRRDDGCW